MFSNFSGTIDAFAGYDNVLAFTVGNEVITEEGKRTYHLYRRWTNRQAGRQAGRRTRDWVVS